MNEHGPYDLDAFLAAKDGQVVSIEDTMFPHDLAAYRRITREFERHVSKVPERVQSTTTSIRFCREKEIRIDLHDPSSPPPDVRIIYALLISLTRWIKS